MDQTVALVARVPALFKADHLIRAVRDLFHGAIELLLGRWIVVAHAAADYVSGYCPNHH